MIVCLNTKHSIIFHATAYTVLCTANANVHVRCTSEFKQSSIPDVNVSKFQPCKV